MSADRYSCLDDNTRGIPNGYKLKWNHRFYMHQVIAQGCNTICVTVQGLWYIGWSDAQFSHRAVTWCDSHHTKMIFGWLWAVPVNYFCKAIKQIRDIDCRVDTSTSNLQSHFKLLFIYGQKRNSDYLNTIHSQYIAVLFATIVHITTITVIKLRSYLNSRTTPHTSPIRASYGVSFVSHKWPWYIESALCSPIS